MSTPNCVFWLYFGLSFHQIVDASNKNRYNSIKGMKFSRGKPEPLFRLMTSALLQGDRLFLFI